MATATSATHSRLVAGCVKQLVCPYYTFMHAVLSHVTAQAAAANLEDQSGWCVKADAIVAWIAHGTLITHCVVEKLSQSCMIKTD